MFRFFAVLAALLLPLDLYAAPTYPDAIRPNTSAQTFLPDQFCPNFKLVVTQSPIPDAYLRGGDTLVISSRLRDLAEQTGAIDFIVAHELMHLQMEHGSTQTALTHSHSKDEFDADRLALQGLSLEPSYALRAANLLERVTSELMALGLDQSYLTVRQRLAAITV